ncbi:uncharacterized protein Z519_02299 [Cladophialophora bantiana CBS 173.52]|uniref:Inositol polyphosphate-related phosphatase domain-containing protein n=1 Tax=Cladophialophora bantiana (strain ATCC 10958 / CBS 173.52 / CDC B-1940 / NIH 8579) TaxID=1442370 RepID=A0A0D2HU08_CLAB1|nr:uncharacterized protein Z519_02299 [Cladophialophora bantiana CBS 173.52]KIW96908.1 hypothetical protein Z519_02299 [Cladophialophora bantiana CBS 173.52]
MSSRANEESYLSPKPWKAGDPWGSGTKLQGVYPPSPEVQGREADRSEPQSLSAAVKARKDEYIRKKSMKIKVGTWNVAAISGTEKDLGAWFVGGYGAKGLSQNLSGLSVEDSDDDSDSDKNIESVESQEAHVATTRKSVTTPLDDAPAEAHREQIDLYVLGLQEVIDVTSMTEAIKPYTDPNPAKKWKKSLRRALPKGYKKVAEEQLLGLLLLIFASPELAPSISSVSTTSVGTGLMGYFGNKGAVAARLVVAEATKLCFINCHLAAGADQATLARRIWDTNQILSRARFSPVTDSDVVETGEEKIGDEDFAFWFGDLNYRLDDVPGQDVRRLLLLHTQNEYDIQNKSKRKIDSELGYVCASSSDPHLPAPNPHYEYKDAERPATESTAEPELDPKSDPASLHTTLQSLLAHDQLRAQQRLGKAFHDGWREGDINFLPTYKYDVGSVGMFDSGDKKRSPSWCDRILYRTRRDKDIYEERARQREEARKKDESMKARGIDEASAEHDVLFDYDPDTDGLAYGDDYDEYEETQDVLHDAELVQSHEDYGDMIELNSYISHQRVLSSDHKPLNAVFTILYDAVIPDLKAKVHQDVAKQLDKAENEGRPSVTVVVDNHSEEPIPNADGAADMNVVHFGEVRYGVQKTRMVTIANTGQITATFSFVERPSESDKDARVVPKWLELSVEPGSIHPSEQGEHKGTYEIVLSPGETTVVDLTIDISHGELVHDLNDGNAELEDVLVLRVENGRDHFIPVKGTWLQSSFYRTLDELVLAPEGGVRQFSQHSKTKGLTKIMETTNSAAHHSAPKELYTLSEILPIYIERSIAEWGMLHEGEKPPWQYETGGTSWPFSHDTWTFHEGEERSAMLVGVREALDTANRLDINFGPDVPSIVRLEVLAETLVSFLRSLRDGVVPAGPWAEVERRLSSLEKGKTQLSPQEIQDVVMDAMSASAVHSVSLTFITFLLIRIVNEMISSGAPAPGSATPTTPTSSSRLSFGRSRASTLSSDSGHRLSTSTQEAPSKRSLFPALRRPRTNSISSSSVTSETGAEAEAVIAERRKKLVGAYAETFAPVVFRAENEARLKGRDKKALDARKRRILEAFLSERPF